MSLIDSDGNETRLSPGDLFLFIEDHLVLTINRNGSPLYTRRQGKESTSGTIFPTLRNLEKNRRRDHILEVINFVCSVEGLTYAIDHKMTKERGQFAVRVTEPSS